MDGSLNSSFLRALLSGANNQHCHSFASLQSSAYHCIVKCIACVVENCIVLSCSHASLFIMRGRRWCYNRLRALQSSHINKVFFTSRDASWFSSRRKNNTCQCTSGRTINLINFFGKERPFKSFKTMKNTLLKKQRLCILFEDKSCHILAHSVFHLPLPPPPPERINGFAFHPFKCSEALPRSLADQNFGQEPPNHLFSENPALERVNGTEGEQFVHLISTAL